MSYIRIVAALLAITVLTRCASDSSMGDIADTVEESLIKLPPAISNISYPDNPNWEQLDLQLSSSLRSIDRVTLNFDSSTKVFSQQLPAQLNTWLKKIKEAGGSVYVCPSVQTENTELVIAIMRAVGEVALAAWQTAATYRPAEVVNAQIFVRETDLKLANAALSRIEFVNRRLELDVDNCKKEL